MFQSLSYIAIAITFAAVGALADPASPPGRSQADGAALAVDPAQRLAHGRLLFEQRWTVAPSGFGRWGRGPTSNGDACTDCHANGARGAPPRNAGEPLRQGVLRLSTRIGELVLPHPAYGEQIQFQGVLGRVPGEAEVYVDWHEHVVTLADGTRVHLRRPLIRLAALAFGELGAESLLSLRMAPALAGVGLLEAVSPQTLQHIAATQAARGLSGRLNPVPNARTGATALGRFGLKSTQVDLHAQVASALHADLGVTSSRFPDENCPPVQWECVAEPVRGRPDISDEQIDDLVLYLRTLPPPARRNAGAPQVIEGARVFTAAGCDGCHLPLLAIGEHSEASVSNAQARAYTDLLLHDLGDGLSDGRPDAAAGAGEWRTAPLWGITAGATPGATLTLLHDGRARSIQEAILWHDGEARQARDAYMQMPRPSRDALVAFIESL
ncbi:MAG: thiol oxidoreductase [Burkholderiales bacterium]|nr:thiol oxidoreductase [Burkholderiales bacterium]